MAAYLENVNKHPVDMWKGQLGKFIRFLQKLLPFLPKNVRCLWITKDLFYFHIAQVMLLKNCVCCN